MPPGDAPRVGYVVKRYPRYSETFIVTEILAHEAAGLAVEIFSLYPCIDSHFQDCISRVRSPVRHVHAENVKASEFWSAVRDAAHVVPDLFARLDAAAGEESKAVYQAVKLAAAAKAGGITHLHAHFASGAANVARLASKLAGVPYSITAHAKDIFHEEVDLDDLRRKVADASTVITVSDYNVRYLRETLGEAAAGGKVRRIYNGLDVPQFPFEDPADRPPLVLGVGRLVEKKGFADLVAACRVLADRGVEFRCTIVGEGECGRALREQVHNVGLGRGVELVGPMPQKRVFDLMRQAAVFAAPCVVGKDQNRDGLPTVLLEAMALGTPCVSTDVTGIPEVLRDGQTGLLARQGDPGALAAAIERLLADGPLRSRLARQARRLIEDEFDITRNAARIREIFAGRGPAAQEGVA